MTKASKYGFCPKCGYTFGGGVSSPEASKKRCPKCGTNLDKVVRTSVFRSRKLYFWFGLLAVIAGVIATFYFTQEDVAMEIRQLREPRPNRFYVGIDVSATIDAEMLEYFKSSITERLKNFVGDSNVYYDITMFGRPGCGRAAVKPLISAQSPPDENTFEWDVQKKINDITVTQKTKSSRRVPLTTPFYYVMGKVLPEYIGGRVIFFSDLLNDDGDCRKHFPFPDDLLKEFGHNTSSQLIFLYPTPPLTENAEINQKILGRQQQFIEKIKEFTKKGNLRAFFYHIPDDRSKRDDFIRRKLKIAIPTTTFEIIWERVTKIIDTMVSAVRG